MYTVLGTTPAGVTVLVDGLTGRIAATTHPPAGAILTEAEIAHAARHSRDWPFWPFSWYRPRRST